MNYKKILIASLPGIENSIETTWWFFEAITTFDGDRDGDLDIYVGMTGAIWDPISSTDPKPYFIENIGADKFILNGISISENIVAGWINNVVVGDFNSDGFDDAFLVDHGREDKPYSSRDFGPLNLLLSSSEGISLSTLKFETLSTWTKPNLDYWHGAINTRDFNLDGHLDIVATALGMAGVKLWFGDGDGNFVLAPESTLPAHIGREESLNGNWLSFGITGFVDSGGDGKADIFALPYGLSDQNSSGYVVINPLSNSGEKSVIDLGNLAVDPAIRNNINRGYSEALVADFDGNGLEDIIAIAEASNGKANGEMFFMFLSQVSPNVFKDVTIESFGAYSSKYGGVKPRGDGWDDLFVNSPSTEISTFDYNGDGYLDLNLGFSYLGQWAELSNTIFLNDGKGHFSRGFEFSVDFNIPSFSSLKSDGVGDLNSDGIGDFFIIENASDINGLPVYNLVLLISDPVQTNSTRHFVISESSSDVRGSNSNDVFTSIGGGSHDVFGYDGIDTITYVGVSSTFGIKKISEHEFDVTKPTQFSSTDRLVGIERIKFTDTLLAIDLDGNAGIAVKTLGAFLGAESATDANLVGYVLNLLDDGMSYDELLQAAVTEVFGENPTGTELVSHFYNTLVGGVAPDEIVSEYAGLVDSGELSATGLAKLVADNEINTTNIDLIGLSSTGVEYLIG